MSALVTAEIFPAEMTAAEDELSTPCNEQPLGVIDCLKEEFGDYSDPSSYDWTWRETD